MRAVEDSEAGFSYIETLIALLILASLSGSAVLFVSGAWAGSSESGERARDLRRILAAEHALRIAAGRIAPPFWLEGPRIDSHPGEYRIDFLDGKQRETLQLRLDSREAVLEIRIPGAATQHLPLPVGTRLTVDDEGVALTVPMADSVVPIRAHWPGRSIDHER